MPVTWSATLWADDLATEDHEALGLARLIWQYRGDQPRIQGFLRALLEQVASLEAVSQQVLTGIWPLTAIGDQLDVLGGIVVWPRGGLTDAEYRLFIVGKIFVNLADGKWPQFFELLEILGYTETMVGYEYVPSAFEVASTSVDHAGPTGTLLHMMAPAGITFFWVYSDEADDDVFKTSSQLAVDEAGADDGTANLAFTTGGMLPSLKWTR